MQTDVATGQTDTQPSRRGRCTGHLVRALSAADSVRSQADGIHKLLFGPIPKEDSPGTGRTEAPGWFDNLDTTTDDLLHTLEQAERTLVAIREALEA